MAPVLPVRTMERRSKRSTTCPKCSKPCGTPPVLFSWLSVLVVQYWSTSQEAVPASRSSWHACPAVLISVRPCCRSPQRCETQLCDVTSCHGRTAFAGLAKRHTSMNQSPRFGIRIEPQAAQQGTDDGPRAVERTTKEPALRRCGATRPAGSLLCGEQQPTTRRPQRGGYNLWAAKRTV